MAAALRRLFSERRLMRWCQTAVRWMALALLSTAVQAQVRVVNLIPRIFGDEITPNPEPTLAVNPADSRVMAVSSFLMGTGVCASSARSPILFTRDGGASWAVLCKMPTPGLGTIPPGDVVLNWS